MVAVLGAAGAVSLLAILLGLLSDLPRLRRWQEPLLLVASGLASLGVGLVTGAVLVASR